MPILLPLRTWPASSGFFSFLVDFPTYKKLITTCYSEIDDVDHLAMSSAGNLCNVKESNEPGGDATSSTSTQPSLAQQAAIAPHASIAPQASIDQTASVTTPESFASPCLVSLAHMHPSFRVWLLICILYELYLLRRSGTSCYFQLWPSLLFHRLF